MKSVTFLLCLTVLCKLLTAQTQYSYFGASHTPKGDLHMLIVFIGFDDATTADDYLNWDHDDIPEWAKGDYNDIIDIDDTQIHTKRNITSYLSTMSDGDFTVTGEVYPELVVVTPNYIGGNLDVFGAVSDAIDDINLQNHPTFDYDWSRFDHRENSPNYYFDNSLYKNTTGDPAGPDDIIDYVCFVIRQEGCSGYSNPSASGKTLVDGSSSWNITTGHTLDKDCGGGGDARGFWHIFLHEMMHTMYTAPHTYHANNVVGDYYYGYQGWGIMANYDAMECANSWERWWLDWISPQDITVDGTYALKDYLAESDALRIPIPNSNQYLFVENHQMNEYFDQKPFYSSESEDLSAGVYAFIAATGSNRTSPINTGNPNANMFKSLNGEGRYDWTKVGTTIVPGVGEGSPSPVFEKGLDNPISGQSDFEWIRGDFDLSDGKINVANGSNLPSVSSTLDSYNEVGIFAAKDHGSGVEHTYSFTGDADLAFTVGDELSISGIIPVLKHVQFHDLGDSLYPVELNGLSITIDSYNATLKEYSISVKFNDWDLNESKRWTGNLSLPENKELTVKSGNSIILNKTGTPNRRESDPVHGLYNPTKLRLLNNSSILLESNASIIVEEYSLLQIQTGADIELGNGAEIIIQEDGVVILEDGGLIKATSANAKIIIENGGTLQLNGNNIQLNNLSAVIDLRNGGTIKTADDVDFTFTGIGHLRFSPGGSFDLGNNSRFVLTGTGTTDVKAWLQSDADLYINNHDIYLEDCKIDYESNSKLRTAFAEFYAEGVLFNDGGSGATNGIHVYDTDSFEVYQCTFDGFHTGIRVEEVDMCPDDDVNVQVHNTTIKNYSTHGIQGQVVDRMYLYANLVQGSSTSTSSVWLEDVVECHIESGTYKNNSNGQGIMLYDTWHFILDGATVKNNDKGIESWGSNIYLRNLAKIKDNTNKGIEAYSASDAISAPTALKKVIVGDLGCGWIVDNGTGVAGEDIIINIDAIEHAIANDGPIYPNRFDGNTTAIDICYDFYDDTYISDELMARNNYWTGGGAPSSSDVVLGFNAACNNITVNSSSYLTSQPTGCNCEGASCEDPMTEIELTTRMNSYSCTYLIDKQGGGRISVAEQYNDAYELFIDTSLNFAYQKFKWLKNHVEAEYVNGLPDGSCKTLYGLSYWFVDEMAAVAEAHCQPPFYDERFMSSLSQNNTVFSMFPNPTSDIVTIGSRLLENVQFSILTRDGRMVENGNFYGSKVLNVGNYPKGLYLVDLYADPIKETLKLIIE